MTRSWIFAAWAFASACSEPSHGARATTTSGDSGASAGGWPGLGGANASGGSAGSGGESGAGAEAGAGAVGGGPRTIEPYFGAGTRLKPIVETVGGADRFTGSWLDTELGVPCRFYGQSSDGVCLPEVTAAVAGYYLDANCVDAVAFVPTSNCADDTAPRVALGPTSDACLGFEPYRIVGEAVAPPVALFVGRPESCLPFPAEAMPAGYDFYAAVPMPRTELAQSNFVVRDRADGMRARVLEAEDGAWLVEGFHDPERDEPCGPLGSDREPADRCVPDFVTTSGNVFQDSSCAVEAVRLPALGSCSEPPPRVALRRSGLSGTCPTITTYDFFSLSAGSEGTGSVLDPEGVCAPSGFGPGTLYPVGEPVPAESFPFLERIVFDLGGVEFTFHGFGGVPFFPEAGFVDRASREPCRAMLIAGSSYCVPNSWPRVDELAPFGALHTESDCSGVPVVAHRADACQPSAGPPGILAFDAACAGRASGVYSAMRFSGSTVYSGRAGGDCEPLAVTDLESGAELYAAGEPLDPAMTFAPVEVRTLD